MSEKLSPERIEKAAELMKSNKLILPIRAEVYKEVGVDIDDLMERTDTSLSALEAVEKIFAWCKTVLKHSEEPCDGSVNSAHNVYMYGARECAEKILKILGGENETNT